MKKVKKGLSYFEKVKLFLKKGHLYLEEKIQERGFHVGGRDTRKERSKAIAKWEECAKNYGFGSMKCKLAYWIIPKAFSTNLCTGGIRGTKVAVSENKARGTGIVVLDGSVLVGDKTADNIVIVEAGHKVRIYPDGKISQAEKINIHTISKWWKD